MTKPPSLEELRRRAALYSGLVYLDDDAGVIHLKQDVIVCVKIGPPVAWRPEVRALRAFHYTGSVVSLRGEHGLWRPLHSATFPEERCGAKFGVLFGDGPLDPDAVLARVGFDELRPFYDPETRNWKLPLWQRPAG